MSVVAPQKEFERLAKNLLKLPHAALGHGKGGFGENALNVHGKIFAMLTSKNLFSVKLPGKRVSELVASGQGVHLEMGSRQMKEWLVVPVNGTLNWQSIATEAYRFVSENV